MTTSSTGSSLSAIFGLIMVLDSGFIIKWTCFVSLNCFCLLFISLKVHALSS